MSKKNKKSETKEFSTGFSKAEWFGQGKQRNKRKPVKNKNSYKKNSPKQAYQNTTDSDDQSDEMDVNKPVSDTN